MASTTCQPCGIQWVGHPKRCPECGKEFPKQRPPRDLSNRKPGARYWCPACLEGRFWARFLQPGSGFRQKQNTEALPQVRNCAR